MNTVIDKILYKAGGYSAQDLAHSKTDDERKQIRQLGYAVIYAVLASTMIWCIAFTPLLTALDSLTRVVYLLPVILVVVPFSFHLNQNLIYHSDVGVEKRPKKFLLFSRIIMVVLATCFSYQALSELNGAPVMLVIPFLLAILELSPLMLKHQMGQTILGKRKQEKLKREYERGVIKGQQYDSELALERQKIEKMRLDAETPEPDPEQPSPSPDSFEKERENIHIVK